MIVSISSSFPCDLPHSSLSCLFRNKGLTLLHIEGISLLTGQKASVCHFKQIYFLQVLGKKNLLL